MFREYDPEVVIGIAKAGVIPGAVVASILQRDFASIAITKEGSVIAGPPRLVTGKRVRQPYWWEAAGGGGYAGTQITATTSDDNT